jgi:peptide/nickel transport system ATP-binding protein
MLQLVGLNPQVMDRLPHEFSGGQRQRIGLARALMLKPDVLIADEPVSALDVTVQAQVLKLLDDVRKQMNLAMLFITHDMRVAAQVCHRVMVMRHGKVVESAASPATSSPRRPMTIPRLCWRRSRPPSDIKGERHAHRHRRLHAGNQQFRALHHHGEDF